ncbi:hypothetical protein H0N99_00130 [Candidatus Micrarchaeota archaeon]|nr:hypothetical protein [Candidatus Micrarchaeota archaeon]
MHKTISDYCLFGDERLFFAGKQELPEGTRWSWESTRKDDSNRSLLRAEALCRRDLIQRIQITEFMEGSFITTKFDSSGRLIRDTHFSNNPYYLALTKKHEPKLSAFLKRVRALHHLHTAEEMFRIRALKSEIEERKKTENPPLQKFSSTAKIVGMEGYLKIYFPKEVSDAIKFGKNDLGEFTAEGKSLVLTLLKKRQYSVRIIQATTSTEVTIPEELVRLKDIYADMGVEWSKESPTRFSLRVVKELTEDALKIYYRKVANTYSVVIPESFDVRAKLHGVLSDEGDKILLELNDNPRYIIKIGRLNDEYARQFQANIPSELAENTGWRIGIEVSFRINEKGQLIITPKEK